MKTKLVLMLAILSIALFSSCKKDEETAVDSIIGNYYSGFAYTGGGFSYGGIYFNEYDVYRSYRIVDGVNAEKTANKNDPYGSLIDDAEQCTYIYNYPQITFTFEDGSTEVGQFIGDDVFRINSINYALQK